MASVVLCLVWVLWAPLAFNGGLAFAPLFGIVSLILLPVAIPALRPRPYMAALVAFFAYAAASAAWSPRPFVFAELDFAAGDVNLRSEAARVGLLFLAAFFVSGAMLRTGDKGQRRILMFATGAMGVQLVIVALLAAFEAQALELFSAFMTDPGEGVQNISRNSLIMAAACPFLILGLTEGRGRVAAFAIAGVILGVELAVLYYRDVQGGMLALAGAGVCIAVVKLLPRNGFRVLGAGVALAIMSAPLVFGYLASGADAVTATTSIEWRLAIWDHVLNVVREHPVIGGGVGVLRTMREQIPEGVFAGEMYIPNHAHNMLLQLWAETGAVGAVLLSAAVVLGAWRLPAPGELGGAGLRVAALAGAMVAIAAVSFDLWNEWWWAVGCLLAGLAIASRSVAASGDAQPAKAKKLHVVSMP